MLHNSLLRRGAARIDELERKLALALKHLEHAAEICSAEVACRQKAERELARAREGSKVIAEGRLPCGCVTSLCSVHREQNKAAQAARGEDK